MGVIGRLKSTGILQSFQFDELNYSTVGITSNGVFHSTLFDENTSSSLTSNIPMRMESNSSCTVYNYIDEFTFNPTYDIVVGTKLPIYGTSGSAYPPIGGWTGIQNSTVDDSFLTINLPFTFYIAGTGYTTTYMGSNTYLTFSSGSSDFGNPTPLGATVPPYPKFHFGSADNSYQRVSRFARGTDYQRIRYEGTAATQGTVGSPNIVIEITLFNPNIMGGSNVLELLVGNHNRTTGVRMVASATTSYATYTLSQNQSYVFVGNSNGTSWTINTGYNVNY
jgi:phage protein U